MVLRIRTGPVQLKWAGLPQIPQNLTVAFIAGLPGISTDELRGELALVPLTLNL